MAHIVYRGESYEIVDPMNWMRSEASFIRKRTGLTIVDVARLSRSVDPDAIAAFLYVAKKRRGEKVRWEDFDDLTMSECDFVRDDGDPVADEDEDDGEGGADPTPPSPTGATRTPGSSTTSTRSRSATTSTRGRSTS